MTHSLRSGAVARMRSRAAAAPFVFFTILAALACGSPTWAMSPIDPVNAADGVALKGYDPVAYFTSGDAREGTEQYGHRWKGATYRFSSAENLELFKAEPQKYAPRYGGYCAIAMAHNRIADIDPERWTIVDGKLYLNSNRFGHALWSVNKSRNIRSGDENWVAFPKKSERE